jgi:cysteinyl-tRNA synthetase
LIAGARVEVSTYKQNATDFALWKIVDKHELGWDSPWGYGRPGWHIECSSMSRRCLATDSIDIHGGGNDLIFPHHENEIAQSEAITGKQYVSTWMHTGHVCIDDTKMSKSLGNFFTIRDVLKKYPGEAIRLFLLSNHYSSPINYTEHRLQEAHKSIKKFYNAIDGVIPILDISGIVNPDKKILQLVDDFYASLSDDMNTPLALAAMFELCNYINKVKHNQTLQAQIAVYYFKQMANTLGVLQQTSKDFLAFGKSDLNIAIIEKLISERQQARLEKNWKLADDLRMQLVQQGVSIKDENGVTTWEKTCD